MCRFHMERALSSQAQALAHINIDKRTDNQIYIDVLYIIFIRTQRERKTKTTNPLNQKYYRYKNNNILYRKRISSTHVRALPAMQYHIHILYKRFKQLRAKSVRCVYCCLYVSESVCKQMLNSTKSCLYQMYWLDCCWCVVIIICIWVFRFDCPLCLSLSCWLSVLCFAFACVCVCVCYWPFAFNAIYYEQTNIYLYIRFNIAFMASIARPYFQSVHLNKIRQALA